MQFEVGTTSSNAGEKKYKGVRRRSWGKWVSEIRVPGTRERLWLGSYSNPEAAAIAHDTAVFFLRGPDRVGTLNFPDRITQFVWTGLSPRSVQKVASDHGMAVDAELAVRVPQIEDMATLQGAAEKHDVESGGWGWGNGCNGNEWREDISIEDMDFYM